MARNYDPKFFEPNVAPRESTFAETAEATFGYRVAPVYELITQTAQYGIQRQSGYVPFDDPQTKGYEQYATHWGRATNSEHMADILSGINRSQKRREVMADASFLTQLTAGTLADPINLVAIPFGGPTVGVARSALRSGAGVGAVMVGAEAVMQAVDPVATAQESAMNILAGTVLGGALGGAAAIPRTNRANVYNNTRIAIEEEMAMHRRIDNLSGLTRDDIANALPRAERPFGSLSEQDLALTIRGFEDIAQRAEAEAESYQGRPEYNDLAARAQEQRDQAAAYKNELGLRSLEDMEVDLKDPYRIMPSAFTESVLYKAVSTPLKRTLQASIPSSVKERFVLTASDGGMALALNSMGIATPNSVYQKAAISRGQWVVAHDKLINIWAKETDASTSSKIDVNYTDLARRVGQRDDTYKSWLSQTNRKRITNAEDLTEGEMAAIDVINTYFKDAERKLESVGLIGTRKGMAQKVARLEDEIVGLNQRLRLVDGKRDARSRRQASMIQSHRDGLTKKLEQEQAALAAFNDVPTTAIDEDVFFPRFWDESAINANRQGLSDILFGWYKQNPYIYELNAKTGEWEKVNLPSDDASIRERVEQSIDRILGENDPTNVDNIGFGYGRSKHFRHRQIDIPNKLVADYIITDPLSVMQTYAARIEPRYEYAKTFGKDIDGVLLDMELDMIAAGADQAKIDAVRRDYVHLYDGVAGTVIKNPDTLSQKISRFLKEASSFSYLGSVGISAIPDFGRIVMEYDLENVIRGTQAMMDKNTVNLAVDETRIAGEALDSIMNTVHMRMADDMTNNIDASNILSTAREAFYMANGLTIVTTVAKQLAGIVDAHTIIDYSIKLASGKLDEQSIIWLARYGIDAEMAKKFARAPWQKTNSGLYMGNTGEWLDSIYIPEVDNKRVNVIEINDDGSPVGKMRGNRYIPAFYRESDNTIRFDRDYIEGSMFAEKAWLNPKMEGVKALPDIFETPKQWANFVMLHEINHTRFSAEDLGFVKHQSDEIVINNAPAGMSRQEIIDNLESGVDNPNLVFHVTNSPKEIIDNGFTSGGTLRGTAVVDSGYGDYITVFDVRSIIDRVKSDQEILDTFQITPDQVDRFLAKSMYGESAFLSNASDGPMNSQFFNLLSGQKPVAAIHISELPQFGSRRLEGDRGDELSDGRGISTAEDKMYRDYRSGVLNRDSLESYKLPPSYWGLTNNQLIEELDKIIQLEDTYADIGKNYNPFEQRVSRPSTVVNKAAYENAINDIALKDYREAQTVNQETIQSFRVALNSGVLNTIMMGTPADKPIISSGVAYIPMRIAKQFGMKEDARVKGYARIENGLMGLPFQFYSYVLANVNKTVGAMATGQVKNRAIGVAAMMGLAYFSLKLKTPDYIWEDMSWRDKFARSFDSSGVAAIYSDIMYTSLHTALALGGPNITGGLISPKFPQQVSALDAVTGLAGAGPSWAQTMGEGLYQFASGEQGEGAKTIARNMPFARMWFWKDEMNQITNAFAN